MQNRRSIKHKLMDWIENEVTEWAFNQVIEHYGVESPDELSQEQIEARH